MGIFWLTVATLSLVLAALYLAICAYVWANQDALILPGASLGLPAVAQPGVDTLWLTLGDGTRLRGGVACPAASTRPCADLPAVLYFGGNAEDATSILVRLANTTGRKAIAYNYRGYAGSAGEPALARLVPDAIEVFGQIAANGRPVAVFGRSIGTGAALAVTANHAVERLVLVSPYDSIKALAGDAAPWLPMSILLRHDLVATEYAQRVAAPVMVILAGADTEISRARSDALIAALSGNPKVVEVPGTGHNDVLARPAAWDAIRGFFPGVDPAGD
jgi:uncharacterized protein